MAQLGAKPNFKGQGVHVHQGRQPRLLGSNAALKAGAKGTVIAAVKEDRGLAQLGLSKALPPPSLQGSGRICLAILDFNRQPRQAGDVRSALVRLKGVALQ